MSSENGKLAAAGALCGKVHRKSYCAQGAGLRKRQPELRRMSAYSHNAKENTPATNVAGVFPGAP